MKADKDLITLSKWTTGARVAPRGVLDSDGLGGITPLMTEAADALHRLLEIMARLRAPDGCPWDREQTLETLRAYLIEEAYEVLEAIDSGDVDAHREELGDLLLQVVFQAQIRAEAGEFAFADVATAIADKLVRRHPHVFGESAEDTPEAVKASWEAIKAQERAGKKSRVSRLDGVPKHMPALHQAFRIGEKAAAAGFDWPSAAGAWAKLDEELDELRSAKTAADVEEELGDVLFATCNVARHLGRDPENALRGAVAKFNRRFRFIEAELDRQGLRLEDCDLDRLEGIWEQAKSRS